MKSNKISYVRTDDNKIINEKAIRWVKKKNECLEVCTKITGCTAGVDTHKICKYNSFDSYNKLDQHFQNV
jgi:hypothetical protein